MQFDVKANEYNVRKYAEFCQYSWKSCGNLGILMEPQLAVIPAWFDHLIIDGKAINIGWIFINPEGEMKEKKKKEMKKEKKKKIFKKQKQKQVTKKKKRQRKEKRRRKSEKM